MEQFELHIGFTDLCVQTVGVSATCGCVIFLLVCLSVHVLVGWGWEVCFWGGAGGSIPFALFPKMHFLQVAALT